LYDALHEGDPGDVLPRLGGSWDVIILEPPYASGGLIELSLDQALYVVLPMISLEDGSGFSDAGGLPIVKEALLEDHLGRLTAVFLLSRSDPRQLRHLLVPTNGEPTGALSDPGGELSRILDSIGENVFELQFIKYHITYRLARRFRSTVLWHALRWCWNRNRQMATVRALATRHPEARGTEVRLLRANQEAGGHAVPWDFIERGRAWQLKPSEGTAEGRYLAARRGWLRIPLEEDPELIFGMGPSGGRIAVAFRKRRETIELYSATRRVLHVYPARAPMISAPPISEVVEQPARSEGGPLGTNAGICAVRFSPAQERFIQSMREAKVTSVAVYCPRWLGISSSTRILFPYTYPAPETPDREPYGVTDAEVEQHARVLLESGVEHVVFSGGDEMHHRLMQRLSRHGPGIRFDVLWHGSYIQFSEDYLWHTIQQWVQAVHEGKVRQIGVVKKGMERFFESVGVPSVLVLNYVPWTPLPPPHPAGESKHLGVWLSGQSYRKLPHAMLGAIPMVRGARLHSAGLDDRGRELVRYFHIPVEVMHERPLPQPRLLRAIRRTHLSLYVTFSECCPMLPLESMSVGVPCLVGPASHLFEESHFLFDRLVVPFPDRADVIASYAVRAIEEIPQIMDEYARYIPNYNAAARRSVEAFIS
jgi:hypothetical protein